MLYLDYMEQLHRAARAASLTESQYGSVDELGRRWPLLKLQSEGRVKLVITANDKDHGIKIEALNIEQILKKGAPTTVEFIADKVGEFPFVCSKFCGFGHGKMKGKLVVEE